MELKKLSISKSKLMSIPEAEQLFFLRFGNLFNEICILRKLAYFSTGIETTDRTIRAAQNSQAFLLLKMLAGKLWEGWRLLEQDFFGTKLSQDYESRLTPIGCRGLDGLKQYFSRDNRIKKIRDELAFHYSNEYKEQMKKILEKLGESEMLDVIISENHFNCLYVASEVVASLASVEWTDFPDGYQQALENFLVEIDKVTKLFLDFLGDCLLVFVKKHKVHFDMTEVDIPDPPKADEIELPYFILGKVSE